MIAAYWQRNIQSCGHIEPHSGGKHHNTLSNQRTTFVDIFLDATVRLMLRVSCFTIMVVFVAIVQLR